MAAQLSPCHSNVVMITPLLSLYRLRYRHDGVPSRCLAACPPVVVCLVMVVSRFYRFCIACFLRSWSSITSAEQYDLTC